MTLTLLEAVFAALVISTAALALYRKFLSMHEDDYVHLSEGEAKYIPQQVTMAHKLQAIDTWGKTLTVLSAVFGVLLVVVWAYFEFMKFR